MGIDNYPNTNYEFSWEARDSLVKKILQMGDVNDPETPNPAVTLEDFFEGNNDIGSIGCNLINHPGIRRFYKVLQNIRAKRRVQDVLIRITYVEDLWPFSDVVYVITSAPIKKVEKWLSPLSPDEVNEGLYWDKELAYEIELKPRMRIVHAWWD